MNTLDNLAITKVGSYHAAFWDAARLDDKNYEILQSGKEPGNSAFIMPEKERDIIREKMMEISSIRPYATVIKHFQGAVDFLSASSDDAAEFIDAVSAIPGFDATDDFCKTRVDLYKAAALVKVAEELVYDASFNIEQYLADRMAKSFVKAENKAFMIGAGTNEPKGLLHATEGAEMALEVDVITYDDIISLFFSLKPEYRKNAIWIMNDSTALTLRNLKDADGNYLWNQASDTILGKTVVICNDMPDAEKGKTPILFGDLSYYWIVDRSPISMKILKELFAANNQIGYVGYEFLDAKLVRREAVKGIAICDTH